MIKRKDKSEGDLHKARNEVVGLKEEIRCLKSKIEFLLAYSEGSKHQRSTKSHAHVECFEPRKNKGSLVIRPDKDISESGLGKDLDSSYSDPYIQLYDANLEVSRLDHLYSDIQQTLNSTIFQMEESEERYKNQVLHVSRERDGLCNEVS